MKITKEEFERVNRIYSELKVVENELFILEGLASVSLDSEKDIKIIFDAKEVNKRDGSKSSRGLSSYRGWIDGTHSFCDLFSSEDNKEQWKDESALNLSFLFNGSDAMMIIGEAISCRLRYKSELTQLINEILNIELIY